MGQEEGRDPRVQGKDHQEGIGLRDLLAKHGVRPHKKFGQHFLVSKAVVGKIITRVGDCVGVLEIGPGPGVLTKPISENGTRIIAVELDRQILPVLQEFAPLAEIIQGDALKTDLAALMASLPEPRALVSNMPYNITGPLLEAFTNMRSLYVRAVLMMQREVAQKILATPGDSGRGALSVVMQAHFEIKRVCQAPPGAFMPPPKVESTVLEFVPRRSELTDEQLETVLTIVRSGFTQPRKTILNNISGLLGREETEALLEARKMNPQLRPHQLTWEQWKSLAE